MRLAHLLFLVALLALTLTMLREPIGRVFVIVFLTGLGELVLGLTAVMALFQTIGSFGDAKEFVEHVEALAATTVVLAIGTAAMWLWLFMGVQLVLTFA